MTHFDEQDLVGIQKNDLVSVYFRATQCSAIPRAGEEATNYYRAPRCVAIPRATEIALYVLK